MFNGDDSLRWVKRPLPPFEDLLLRDPSWQEPYSVHPSLEVEWDEFYSTGEHYCAMGRAGGQRFFTAIEADWYEYTETSRIFFYRTDGDLGAKVTVPHRRQEEPMGVSGAAGAVGCLQSGMAGSHDHYYRMLSLKFLEKWQTVPESAYRPFHLSLVNRGSMAHVYRQWDFAKVARRGTLQWNGIPLELRVDPYSHQYRVTLPAAVMGRRYGVSWDSKGGWEFLEDNSFWGSFLDPDPLQSQLLQAELAGEFEGLGERIKGCF